jgi:hypothetical protein
MDGISRKVMCILLATALVAACTSPQPVPSDPAYIRAWVRTGDHVRIVLRDGELLKFKVIESSADSLVGKDQSVPYEEILQIEVKRYDDRKTSWLVGVIVIGMSALLIITIVTIASYGLPPSGA